MKITQKASKKVILVTIISILIVVSGLAYYVFGLNGSLFGWKFHQDTASNTIDLAPPTQEQQKAGQDAKQSAIDEDQGKPNQDSDSPKVDEDTLKISFTSVYQNDTTLQARVQIDPLVSKGSCTLTLVKDGSMITKTAAVYAMASISTCQGFDVPVSELSVGTWNLTISVTSSSASGSASTSTQIQ